MKIIRAGTFLAAVLAAVAGTVAAASVAIAQTYPAQRVTIVVPFSPGSTTDNLARILADKLGDVWKQPVIVENRPGIPGTAAVAKAPPDGYTLMLTSNGHTIAAAISKNPQYDPVHDFAGVTQVASVPLVAIVPPDFPANTIAAFIALAKQSPGKLNFSSAGVASTSYLAGEIFKQQAAIDIVHVPFRGGPEAVTAVLRGDAQLYFSPIPGARDLIATGKVKAIAVNSPGRVQQIPDIPTMPEAGMRDYKYDSWFAVLAPAGTAKAIRDRVSRDIAAVLKIPEVSQNLLAQGAVPVTNTPEEFDTILRNDTARYEKLLKDAKIEPQ